LWWETRRVVPPPSRQVIWRNERPSPSGPAPDPLLPAHPLFSDEELARLLGLERKSARSSLPMRLSHEAPGNDKEATRHHQSQTFNPPNNGIEDPVDAAFENLAPGKGHRERTHPKNDEIGLLYPSARTQAEGEWHPRSGR
jgi:hypothetical protein